MKLPKHIAIICDGNRRWAKQNGLKAVLGHKRAVDEVFEPLIDRAIERSIEYLTFWVFSTENWNRSSQEVSALMELFRNMLGKDIEKMHKKGVCLKVIGDVTKFDADIQQKIVDGVNKTARNTRITVIFAMNYGGRDELVRAVNTMVKSEPGKDHYSAADISSNLDTADIPDPDLIVRTSGEQRLSGFLLWQSEYAELAFPAYYFPEFTPDKLDELIEEFAHRKRRFGK